MPVEPIASALGLLLTVASLSVGDECSRPACREGDKWDGKYCWGSASGTKTPSRYRPTCPDGSDLDAGKGTCVRRDCAGRSIKAAPAAVAAPVAAPQPDLAITRFEFVRWTAPCRLKDPVVVVRVQVENVGTADLTRSAVLTVTDTHEPEWTQQASVLPLARGGVRVFEIPITYYARRPRHMMDDAPHPFRAVIDPGNVLQELQKTNNASGISNIGAPAGCVGVRLW